MKRSMVIYRPSTEDITRFLGRDNSSPTIRDTPIGPITEKVDWNNIHEGQDKLWYINADGYPAGRQGKLADYRMVEEKD